MRFFAAALWALAAAAAAGMVLFGVGMAVAWLLIWGDSPWPHAAMPLIGILALLTAAASGWASGRAVWQGLAAASPLMQTVVLAFGGAIFALIGFWAWHESLGTP